MNPNYKRAVLKYDELRFLISETQRIGTNPKSDAKELRKAAQMHAVMAAHHSACILNLIDNADEAEANKKNG